MKDCGLYWVMVAFVCSAFLLSPSHAQTVSNPTSNPTSSRDIFPKLPPSSLCTREKLVGIWKLIMVYEVPSGREMELYYTHPLQYYVFEADNRYGDYVSVLYAATLKEVKETALSKQKALQQYIIDKSGMVFFYKERIAVDSLACFIVAKATPPFMAGQMLLMPPEKSTQGRMVKVYQKMYMELEADSTK